MNELATFSIGPIMKAARKFKKLNQADVARAIGCSQSALSKMEHNLLVPSAPQWFLFSRFTAIPPETLESGIIDRHSLVKHNNDEVSLGFKIPKKYRTNRAQKVREIYPFLQYLEKKKGQEQVDALIAHTGLDPEFFLDFDNLINFQLFADSAAYFIGRGHGKDEDIEELVKIGQNNTYWNHYGVEWKKLSSVKDVIQEYVNEQLFFQTDFQLRLEDGNNGKLILSYIPEYHLKQFKEINDELVKYLNTYRKFTLQNLVQRVLGYTTRIEFMQTEQQGLGLAARFEIFPKDA